MSATSASTATIDHDPHETKRAPLAEPFFVGSEAGQPFLPVSSGRPRSRANSASISSTEKGSATFSAGFGGGAAAGLPAGAGRGLDRLALALAFVRLDKNRMVAPSIVLLAVSHRRRSLTAMISAWVPADRRLRRRRDANCPRWPTRQSRLARRCGESGVAGRLRASSSCFAMSDRIAASGAARSAGASSAARTGSAGKAGGAGGATGEAAWEAWRSAVQPAPASASGATGTSAACSSDGAQAGPRGPGGISAPRPREPQTWCRSPENGFRPQRLPAGPGDAGRASSSVRSRRTGVA